MWCGMPWHRVVWHLYTHPLRRAVKIDQSNLWTYVVFLSLASAMDFQPTTINLSLQSYPVDFAHSVNHRRSGVIEITEKIDLGNTIKGDEELRVKGGLVHPQQRSMPCLQGARWVIQMIRMLDVPTKVTHANCMS